MSEVERRFTPGVVEIRAGKGKAIGGYAAKFGKESKNLGGFVEVIAPTAFNRSRGNGWPDVMVRYNHDDMWLLGTTGAGSLRLATDDVGLTYEVDLNPDDPQAASVAARVARGDVRKSSFAFRVIGEDGDGWGLTDQGYPLRTLNSVELVDVAPVNSPAYDDTTTGMRADLALRSLAVQMEATLEDVKRLAASNDLKRFFTRTDTAGQPKKSTQGPAARIALLARQTDPWA